jgi:hypothetical protein
MASWRATKDAWVFCSDAKLRATVMSTILPEEMLGGRRMEGNSICGQDLSSAGHHKGEIANAVLRAILGFVRVSCPWSAGPLRPHRPCRLSARSASWIVSMVGVEDDGSFVDSYKVSKRRDDAAS